MKNACVGDRCRWDVRENDIYPFVSRAEDGDWRVIEVHAGGYCAVEKVFASDRDGGVPVGRKCYARLRLPLEF